MIAPRVDVVTDEATGLWAAVAVDREVGGVAAGGIRIKAYPDDESAIADARGLAAAMTLKASVAGIRCGGAKVTVRADRLRDRAAALELLGRHVEARAGALYVGPDFGFTDEDRVSVARGTRFVDAAEIADQMALATATGVRDCLRVALAVDRLAGARVAVQGLGKVGGALAALLRAEGAEVYGYDPDGSRMDEAGVRAIDEMTLLDGHFDALAPCALGGAVDLAGAARLQSRALVGAANHLLASPAEEVAALLDRRGIVHVPDFLANAGAFVLWAAAVLDGKADPMADVARIGETAREVLRRARTEGRTPLAVAHTVARERLS